MVIENPPLLADGWNFLRDSCIGAAEGDLENLRRRAQNEPSRRRLPEPGPLNSQRPQPSKFRSARMWSSSHSLAQKIFFCHFFPPSKGCGCCPIARTKVANCNSCTSRRSARRAGWAKRRGRCWWAGRVRRLMGGSRESHKLVGRISQRVARTARPMTGSA